MEKVKSSLSFICKELLLIYKLTFPVYLTSLCLEFIFIIPAIFVGHTGDGKTALAAFTLSFAFTTFSGWGFLSALSSSLDTLASQAYGATDLRRLGILLQRSVLIHIFLVIPIAILWINIENILIILNQQPETIILAGQYIHFFIFIIPAIGIHFSCMKILQMQNIVLPSTIIAVCGIVLDIVLCYLFVFLLDMGITGAALGQVLVMYAMMVVHLLYLRMSSVWERIWGGWSWEAWEKWGQYFYYGVPVVATNLNEIIAIQVGGFVVGMVGDQPDVAISVYSTLTYLDYFIYIIPLSLSTATAIRIGNLIGEGDIGRVKKVGVLFVTTQVLLSIFQSIVLIGGSSVWGAIFSSDPNVIRGVANNAFIIAIYHPFDSLASVFQGILRGSGKQDIGLLMAFTFAIIAYPLSIGFSVGLRLIAQGYLLGIMTGYLARTFVCFFIALCCIKWEAIRRVDSESVQPNDPLLGRSLQSSQLVGSFHSQHSISDPLQTNTKLENDPVDQTPSSKSRKISMIKKIISFLILVALLILMVSCKFGSRRLSFSTESSYLQLPLEFCCFSYVPLRNISK